MSHPQADTIRGSYRRGWSIAMLAVTFDLTQGQVRAILANALDDVDAERSPSPGGAAVDADAQPAAAATAQPAGAMATAPAAEAVVDAPEAPCRTTDNARVRTPDEARIRTTAAGRGCQWIEGDLVPGREPAFCGAARREGSSYCPAHHLRAYQAGTATAAQREQRRSARRLPAGGAEELDFA